MRTDAAISPSPVQILQTLWERGGPLGPGPSRHHGSDRHRPCHLSLNCWPGSGGGHGRQALVRRMLYPPGGDLPRLSPPPPCTSLRAVVPGGSGQGAGDGAITFPLSPSQARRPPFSLDRDGLASPHGATRRAIFCASGCLCARPYLLTRRVRDGCAHERHRRGYRRAGWFKSGLGYFSPADDDPAQRRGESLPHRAGPCHAMLAVGEWWLCWKEDRPLARRIRIQETLKWNQGRRKLAPGPERPAAVGSTGCGGLKGRLPLLPGGEELKTVDECWTGYPNAVQLRLWRG